jgi:hypothetical protein
MITGLRYVNSKGDAFDFDAAGVHPVPDTVWDWEASVLELNGETAAYTRSARTVSVPVTLTFQAPPYQAMDALYDVAAYDLANDATGQLVMGDWSMPAALVKSEKARWWRSDGPVAMTLSFRSPRPFWTREAKQSFFPVAEAGSALDYPHDFPFDYGGQGQAGFVSNASPYPADFVLTIYGPATNPYVIIGGNRYEASVDVPSGGLLVIDSEAGTVTLSDSYGAQTNAFGDTPDSGRGSGDYIFEPIPSGDQQVSWDGTFGFDLAVKVRRDERVWIA